MQYHSVFGSTGASTQVFFDLIPEMHNINCKCDHRQAKTHNNLFGLNLPVGLMIPDLWIKYYKLMIQILNSISKKF